MLRILLPLSFGLEDPTTLAMARHISRLQPCRITLLHCRPPVTDIEISQSPNNQEREDCLLRLEKYSYDLHTSKGQENGPLQTVTILKDGYPSEVIAEMVTNSDYHLVVMTSTFAWERMKEITGSVTLDVIHHITTPILSVPDGYVWCGDRGNILLNLDFTQNNYTALHQLISLMATHGETIHCVQFTTKLNIDKETDGLTNIKEYLRSTYRNVNIQYDLIRCNNVFEAMNSYIADNLIQLVTLTRHHRPKMFQFMMKDEIKRALGEIEIPILIINI